MKPTYYILLFFLLSFGSQTKAQHYTPKQIDHLIDSSAVLSDKRKEMAIALKAYKIADEIHYGKGKMKSLQRIIRNYTYMGNQKKVIELSDQLKKIAEEENNGYFQVKALNFKTYSYIYNNFFKNAEDIISQSFSIAETMQGDDHYAAMGDIYKCKAEVENFKKNSKARLICNKKSVENYLKIVELKRQQDALSAQYHNISISYLDFKKRDSAIYYNKEAIRLSKLLNNKPNEAIALLGLGYCYYTVVTQPSDNDSALRYFFKAEPILSEMRDYTRLNSLYMGVSVIYEELGNTQKYIYYDKKSKELSDKANQSKLLLTDEISNQILEIETKKDNFRFYVLLAASMLVIILILIFAAKLLLRFKKIKELKIKSELALIEKYEKQLEEKSAIRNTEKEILASANISDQKEHELMKKLNNFEKKEHFLSPEISLSSMASAFNTNVNYLSKLIKKYRDNNFSSYINELRINYITKKLRSNPEYLNYKISYLAEECGFTSYSSFVSIFKQQTGITPSKFIDYLREEMIKTNQNDH